MKAVSKPRRKVASKWMRNASDEAAVREGCYFDNGAGKAVVEFVESYCRQSQGDWGGQLLRLMPWQKDFIMRLFGWKRPSGKRRFRIAYLEICKKNGKSTLASALALALLLADGEQGPKGFLNACDRSQARIVFDEAAHMVHASPDLEARLGVNETNHRITCPANNGVLRANSSEADSKDGANASYWINDEVHRWPDDKLYKMFRHAGAARSQPLEINITTAGEDEAGLWFKLREHAEQIQAGSIVDIGFLGIVYRASKEDDIDDPAVWRKANPSLGHTIDEAAFAEDLARAKQSPADLAEFMRLRLGIVVSSTVSFLDPAAVRACCVPQRPLEDRVCVAGLDLSSVSDLTSFSILARDSDGSVDAWIRSWIPADAAAEKERSDRVPYRMWERSGHVEFTPGNAIDYEVIEDAIVEDVERHNIQVVYADPWNATDLCQRLIKRGVNVVFIRQGYSLSPATKEVERLFLAREIRLGANPVAEWAFANAVVERDRNGNSLVSKRKSRAKIDPLAATINGVAAFSALPDPEDSVSVYETSEMFFA